MLTKRTLLAGVACLPLSLLPVPALPAAPRSAVVGPQNAHLYALITDRVEKSLFDYVDNEMYPFHGAFPRLAHYWLVEPNLHAAVLRAVENFYKGKYIRSLVACGSLNELCSHEMNWHAQQDALSVFPLTPQYRDKAFFAALAALAPQQSGAPHDRA